jgi:Tetratricopeptide repeat/WD40-like Beta Propeller Repeat
MQKRLLAIGLLLLLGAVVMTAGQNGSDLYQQGLARETAGDIKGAIEIFERIVREFPSNRTLAARALLQLGRWSDLLGQDQARKYYERVVREFADQKEAAADARTRLDTLARAGAPVPSPARRLVVESKTGGSSIGRATRDGRHLLRYNEEQRAFELVEIGTGAARQLTTEGPSPAEAVVGGTPELSTDGRRLAAVVRLLKPGSPAAPLQEISQTELRVFEVGGRGPGRVLATWDERALGGTWRPFAWAPRNDRIWLFSTRNDRSAQIASVNLSGKLEVLKTLTWRDTGQFPSLSPDGSFLAYHDAAGRQTPSDLFIIATDGSREHRVEHAADDSKPTFLPDGSGVVFESNRRGDRDLWFLTVADGKPTGQPRLVWRDVAPFGEVEGFSDTGSLFFYSTGHDYGTYTLPLDLSTPAGLIGELTRLAPVNNETNNGAAFSPDGRYLAHFRANGARLVLRELATGLEREIPFGAQLSHGSALDRCPSGDALIATGYIDGTGGVAFRVNVKDTSVQRLAPVSISYIPARCLGDGQEIIHLRAAGNPWVRPGSIVRRSLASGRETTLYEGAFAPLALSMDGSRLAFAASEPTSGRRILVTMSAQGGDLSADVMPAGIRQPPEAVIYNAAWMPSGDRLLIDARDAGESYDWAKQLQVPFWLWDVPLTGAAPRRLGLLPLPKVEGTFYGPVSFSVHPNGKLLAFQTHEGLVRQTWALDNLFQFIKAGSK